VKKHRIRLTGLAVRGHEVLLVEQESPRTGIRRWSTPGGGLEYDDADIFRGVEREMYEETGLVVQAGAIRFMNEFFHVSTDQLMLDVWIDCHPVGGTWGEATMDNIRADDFITDLRWWSREAFCTSDRLANVPLLNPLFWDNLHAPVGPVIHLGRWEG
jgi:8-oxo-dGTP pyrophosphatase MutT (NUDIX family)